MSVGIVASSVVIPSGVDVLMEPFNNFTFAPWTLTGTPTIVAGRTGTAASILGTANRADYSLAANESDYVTIGFAWRTNTVTTNIREVVLLYSNTNTIQQARLIYDGTTAQTLTYRTPAAVLGTSSTGLIPVNTWAYVELQARIHATAGTVVVRVNGSEVLNLSGVNTNNATGDGLIDTVRLFPNSTGVTNVYDDLYLTVGSGAAFKGDHTIP